MRLGPGQALLPLRAALLLFTLPTELWIFLKTWQTLLKAGIHSSTSHSCYAACHCDENIYVMKNAWISDFLFRLDTAAFDPVELERLSKTGESKDNS